MAVFTVMSLPMYRMAKI